MGSVFEVQRHHELHCGHRENKGGDILSADDLALSMGERGRKKVKENFLIPHLIEKWIDTWRELLL